MKVVRKDLLNCLDKVMQVISSKAAPDNQKLKFYGSRVQATNGSIWVDAALPEGMIELKVHIDAEPFYNLIRKLTSSELDLVVKGGVLQVLAKDLEGEFTVYEYSSPIDMSEKVFVEIKVEDLNNLIDGLRFCRLGACKDETAGPICGIKIQKNELFSCDRYRILNWKLKSNLNLECTIPVKLAELLHSFRGEIAEVWFSPGSEQSGVFRIQVQDGTIIWATTIEGVYKDLTAFFPTEEHSETVELSDNFPAILDRHVALLKGVSGEDLEILFKVEKNHALTQSFKLTIGGEKERDLKEDVALKNERTGEPFEFCVNPMLLKDVVGLCLGFKYYKESSIVLFATENFRYLLKTRS